MKEQHCSELEAAFVVADLMEGKSVRGVYDRRLRDKKSTLSPYGRIASFDKGTIVTYIHLVATV